MYILKGEAIHGLKHLMQIKGAIQELYTSFFVSKVDLFKGATRVSLNSFKIQEQLSC